MKGGEKLGVFHEGEIAVQDQAGVRAMARRVGGGIYPTILEGAAEFLEERSFVVVASRDSQGRTWASILTGMPGFLRTIDATTLQIQAQPDPDDPLSDNLLPGSPLGLLAIHFATRSRMRLNGTLLRSTTDGLVLASQEVYGNCQKYIQARALTDAENIHPPVNQPVEVHREAVLTPQQQSWIGRADTFFIASTYPTGNADASHRGGNPGLVRVVDERRLIFPDYMGNMMFNTLGNLAVNPSAGLLFLDFEAGHTLQLTGHATIVWDQDQIATFPGAQRLTAFDVHEVVERRGGSGLRFGSPEYSRFNPR